MDTGQFFSGTIATPPAGSRPLDYTAKGICIRLGEHNQAAICYDTELLRISAGWTGPFLNMDPARYGIIQPPAIAGEVQFVTPQSPGWAQSGTFRDTRPRPPFGPLPRNHARYQGLYPHANRVVLAYSVGTADVRESPWFETVDGTPIFTRTFAIGPGREELELLACGPDGWATLVHAVPGVSQTSRPEGLTSFKIPPRDAELRLTIAMTSRQKSDLARLSTLVTRLTQVPDLHALTKPAAPRWTEPIVTHGEIGDPGAGPFAIDTITLPFDNPYRALFFVSGHDFFRDGSAAVCTLHGDVWRVTGIDDRLERIRWQRFATGLFQPLGLKIVQDQVYVVGRDQITRLHDRDGNGEADYYENFNNEGQVTTNGHEYVTCLEIDRRGNFYYLKGDSGGRTEHDGCLLRVSPDGSRLDVVATGFRNANGLGIGPRDEITVAPQEGEWTPASGIFAVQPGGFHGAMSVHHQSPPPSSFVQPICWLSRRTDNSSGGQVWVPDGRWGPLAGKLLHFSYGQCTAMLVLTEDAGGQQQGGVVPLPLLFQSGAMRGRFHPQDGQLYVSGLHGWVSNAVADGCFQRVRYVAKPVGLPVQVKTMANGLLLAFDEPLLRHTAEDLDSYRAEQWNYRWSAQYGSPELRPSQPNMEGRDPVAIESATLLDDRRTVFLEIPDLCPVSLLQLDFLVEAESRGRVERRLMYTVHRVPPERMPETRLTGRLAANSTDRALRESLLPGLQFRCTQPAPTSTRPIQDVAHRRLAAISVAAGDSPAHRIPPGPFRVVMEGYVRPKEPGSYRIQPTGSGSARVFLGNEEAARLDPAHATGSSTPQGPGTAVELRGLVPLRIEYEPSQPERGAEFRLLWQREGGIEEPISPEELFCDGRDASLRSAQLAGQTAAALTQFRCLKCHTLAGGPGSASLEALTADGPSLTRAGDRLNPDWVAAWLLEPEKLRNETHMPALLGDPDSPEARQQAADLAAFLATLTGPEPPGPGVADPAAAAADDDRVQRGGQLWEQLGCIGCHRLTPVGEPDPFARLSLQHTAGKFRPGSLVRFLLEPLAHYSWSRMPDFRLTADEAQSLAAFLVHRSRSSNSAPDRGPADRFPQGNAAAGKRLAESYRCHACHDLGPELPRPAAVAARTAWKLDQTSLRGCLAPPAREAAHGPRFPLSQQLREGIGHALRDAWFVDWRTSPIDDSNRLVDSLRCGVCHARDDQPAQLPRILAEDGEIGLLGESLPNLTWAGERLRTEWAERLIGGRIPERPRPFLTMRMPAFPAYADVLAVGFAAQHGVGPSTSRNAPPDTGEPSRLENGYRLTQRDGGLDCRQCHAVGSLPAQGDDQTRLAPGINFALVPQRLRYDFYRRFVLDPPRYDANTRMPKLSPDGRTTPIGHYYQGDAANQFDAIWAYLQTVHGTEP